MSDALDNLAVLMGSDVPPAISRVFPGAQSIPTTDTIDGLFTEQDKADRYKVMAQCQHCHEWTQIEQWKPAEPCSGCGQKKYDPTSYTSLRTFNPVTAKRRKIRGSGKR